MAVKFWQCQECGFENKPHAFRRGDEANAKCEQCGADQVVVDPPAASSSSSSAASSRRPPR